MLGRIVLTLPRATSNVTSILIKTSRSVGCSFTKVSAWLGKAITNPPAAVNAAMAGLTLLASFSIGLATFQMGVESRSVWPRATLVEAGTRILAHVHHGKRLRYSGSGMLSSSAVVAPYRADNAKMTPPTRTSILEIGLLQPSAHSDAAQASHSCTAGMLHLEMSSESSKPRSPWSRDHPWI